MGNLLIKLFINISYFWCIIAGCTKYGCNGDIYVKSKKCNVKLLFVVNTKKLFKLFSY